MSLDLSKLDAIIAGLPQALDDGAKAVAEAVIEKAEPNVPVDTGELKGTGQVYKGDAPAQYVASYGKGLPDARAVFNEYGTSKMAAQPYMTPASEQVDVDAVGGAPVRKLIGGT